jgi:hypothetical protein
MRWMLSNTPISRRLHCPHDQRKSQPLKTATSLIVGSISRIGRIFHRHRKGAPLASELSRVRKPSLVVTVMALVTERTEGISISTAVATVTGTKLDVQRGLEIGQTPDYHRALLHRKTDGTAPTTSGTEIVHREVAGRALVQVVQTSIRISRVIEVAGTKDRQETIDHHVTTVVGGTIAMTEGRTGIVEIASETMTIGAGRVGRGAEVDHLSESETVMCTVDRTASSIDGMAVGGERMLVVRR